MYTNPVNDPTTPISSISTSDLRAELGVRRCDFWRCRLATLSTRADELRRSLPVHVDPRSRLRGSRPSLLSQFLMLLSEQ